MKCLLKDSFVIITIYLSLVPNIALAYIDPGTGSIIISAIVFVLATIGYYIRFVVQKIKEFFSLLSTGVPGSVAGLLKAQERFGRLSRIEVMAPSIQLADDGFVIYPQLADSLKRAFPRLRQDPTARSLFYRQVELPGGGAQWIAYQSGELLRQPELAQSLKLISLKGTLAFYEGKIDLVEAQKILN